MKSEPFFYFKDSVTKGWLRQSAGSSHRESDLFDFGTNTCCPYCKISCEQIYEANGWYFSFCRRCGWWGYRDYDEPDPRRRMGPERDWEEQRVAILKELDISKNGDDPIEVIGGYLKKHKERIVDIHPNKFEALVAAIWKEVTNSHIEYVSYGRQDKGIDVIAINDYNGQKYAIQCKRYKNPIELGSIHQFCGALIQKSLNKGIFVTSSYYRKGCYEAQKLIRENSQIEIDLVDGKYLLEMLDVCNFNSRTEMIPDNILNSGNLIDIAGYFGIPAPTFNVYEEYGRLQRDEFNEKYPNNLHHIDSSGRAHSTSTDAITSNGYIII